MQDEGAEIELSQADQELCQLRVLSQVGAEPQQQNT
jgi:hypothetical protein